MPTLLERFDADLKDAMRNKQALKVSTLRMLKSALKYHQIEKKLDDLKEPDVIAVIQKQIKQRKDSIESYRTGGRDDLVKQETEELAVLQAYLPQGLSPEELEALVKAAIQEIGATSKAQIGQVMKAAIAKAAGRADGKSINAVALRILG
jgi:uncharacterized protein YqeY